MGNNPPKEKIKVSETIVYNNNYYLHDRIIELKKEKDELNKKLRNTEYNYKNVTEDNKRLQEIIDNHSQKIREKNNIINQNETLNKELKKKNQ